VSASESKDLSSIGRGNLDQAGEQREARSLGYLRGDCEELNRFLEEAIQHLKNSDLASAEQRLKKVSIKATSIWVASGGPTLPQPLTDLDGFRENLRRLRYGGRTTDPGPLVYLLEEIHSQFENHSYLGTDRRADTPGTQETVL
jgi:hypothetical protein